MEDFGHHPTALAATLASLRQRYPKHDLVAAFEPRSNTAVTNRFQAEFAEALALADQVLLAPPYRGELVPRDQRLDREALAESIRNKSMPGIQLKQPGAKSGTPPGKQVSVCADFGEVESCLAELRAAASRESPVLLVCFSNGSFGGVPKKLADAWQAQSLG
jgi:UDP-N-acetylmuramate: L-alanyl-gamma-D-glutamyl-meso-diaminopimelate ligase